MANDRIYLRCNKCQEKIMIYKYYCEPTGSFVPNNLKDLLDDFLKKHVFECQEAFGMSLDIPNYKGFVTVTEKDLQ